MAAADPPRNTGLGQVFAEDTRQSQETEYKNKAKTRQIKSDRIILYASVQYNIPQML